MSGEDVQQAILDWLKGKSGGGKARYTVRDVVKAMKEHDLDKKDVKAAITECIKAEKLMYWSSGSSTYVVLPEYFPKSVT